MKITLIEATTIPDLWFQALHGVLTNGIKREVARGSFKGQERLELSYFIGHILRPFEYPRIPEFPENINIPEPVSKDYEEKYIYDFLVNTGKKKEEEYTYGERINSDKMFPQNRLIGGQKELICSYYKNYGHNTNQNIIQVSKITDLALKDPPCLRHIDTRIEGGKLNFIVYFRSWDLWGGLPANLSAIQALKEAMAADIGVGDGEMIVESKGLHIYDHCIPLAKTRCNME